MSTKKNINGKLVRSNKLKVLSVISVSLLTIFISFCSNKDIDSAGTGRERISINKGWKFFKYDRQSVADSLIYDVRPFVAEANDSKDADTKPTDAVEVKRKKNVLKPWVMPTGNEFVNDSTKHYFRPEGNPGNEFPFVQNNFEDSSWENVNLPHDWAIKGPFYEGPDPEVGGGMGRLPIQGTAWYRRKIDIPVSDSGKSIYLDIDGAMSYSIVWLNGKIVGGWPYGYASWRLDLTPYIEYGNENQLAIRLDNPNYSARWYPGGGLYRNVWLIKTNPVHVMHWGTKITTSDVSDKSAKIDLEVNIENNSSENTTVKVLTQIFKLDSLGNRTGESVADFNPLTVEIKSEKKSKLSSSVIMENPELWGPPPAQIPHRYVAVTCLWENGNLIDTYETKFGIRTLRFDPDSGIYVNGELIKLKGVNQHHDLGAIGSAFNMRAAERQLEILREMGCNAIRTSHNPPAPELLELTDRMGFLVMDEIFDCWEMKKTPLDFHLIFPDWYEQDLRTFVRRDKNCPSVIIWSIGNEVGEQYTGKEGAAIAERLSNIVKEEDATRPTTTGMNWAKPDMLLPASVDLVSLNYQGEGIRQDPIFEGTERIRTKPMYDAFHKKFPGKVVLSSESASAASSRGIYLFPVTPDITSPIRDGRGGDSQIHQVSSYELYSVDFGSSVDKVFSAIDHHLFVAGEFVWNGFDYIGEPTPYYEARSSYTGIIDLAGFKKDRFFLYQAHWRPDLPMIHILPHWNWPDRLGKITPVHVITSGDEVELFLNGQSLGRKKKGRFEYRLRWDDIKYEPGELKAVAYKNGSKWAEEIVKTTGKPAGLNLSSDRNEIIADGNDLSFITVRVTDNSGLTVPQSDNLIKFSCEGPGEIIATDNGDAMDFTPFVSQERQAFNGLCLVIVKGKPGESGKIILKAESDSLASASTILNSISGN